VRRTVRAWRLLIPSRSAASSAISSRTSVIRACRFARFLVDAFSRRAARQVSSDRAAASANSSHSRCRVRAAVGVIALPGPRRSLAAGLLAGVPAVPGRDLVLARPASALGSVIHLSSGIPSPYSPLHLTAAYQKRGDGPPRAPARAMSGGRHRRRPVGGLLTACKHN